MPINLKRVKTYFQVVKLCCSTVKILFTNRKRLLEHLVFPDVNVPGNFPQGQKVQ